MEHILSPVGAGLGGAIIKSRLTPVSRELKLSLVLEQAHRIACLRKLLFHFKYTLRE